MSASDQKAGNEVLIQYPHDTLGGDTWELGSLQNTYLSYQIIIVLAGLVNPITQFLAKPVKQVLKLMGETAQLTRPINSLRYQADLLQMRVNDAGSVGEAAKEMPAAVVSSIKLMVTVFEQPDDGNK